MVEKTAKKRKIFTILLFSILFCTLFVACNVDLNINSDNNGGMITKYNLEEKVINPLEVTFCPSYECFSTFFEVLNSSKKEIKCAFFEFDNVELSELLNFKLKTGVDIEIIVDNNYLDEDGIKELACDIKLYSDEPRTKLMHNKFCVIDKEILLTGSTNPTDNGIFKNNNNLLIINSKYLSKNYLAEFEEMKNGKYGGEDSNSIYYNDIILVDSVNDAIQYEISNYFCPENDCEDKILTQIKGAKKSITFASFVLTSNPIENLLIEKANIGVDIQGLIENRMKNTKGSILEELNKTFPIYLDVNKNTMHHKVFVIDSEIVITGSMNPSASGNSYNDENILIIKNKNLAEEYETEILKLIENSKKVS